MDYHKYNILCDFGGIAKYISVVAVDLPSAIADLAEAFGEFRFVCYGISPE